MKRPRCWVHVAALFTLSLQAGAALDTGLINVDIAGSNSFATPVYSGAGVTGQSGDFWNRVPVLSLRPIPLRMSDGSSSSVHLLPARLEARRPDGTIFYFAAGFGPGSTNPMSIGPYGGFMRDGWGGDISLQPGVFTISGLTGASEYEIFAYSYVGGIGQSLFTAGGVQATVVNVVGIDQLIEGQSYARLLTRVDASGTLTLSLANTTSGLATGAPRALNGFQIRPFAASVPEPGTACAAVVAILICSATRRRPS